MKASTPNLYCQQKTARSGSSFYYSFLFLSPPQRQAIQAIYAFCREVDDIADDYQDINIARIKLAWWHQEIDRLFAGQAQHPISQAIAHAQTRYDLKSDLFHAILEGMEMDLDHQGYSSFDDLKPYCYRVASATGLLGAEIFGYHDRKTLEYAEHLGLAFQLVNIIRDVGEDARRGRVYLPQDELAQFGLNPHTILARQYSENFAALMQHQAERARYYYREAKSHLPAIDVKSQSSGLIMAETYFSLLDEIEKMHFQVLHQKITLTPLRKAWIAWKTARQYRRLPITSSQETA